jgi:isoamylase
LPRAATGIQKLDEDSTLLLIFNAWHDVVEFTLPSWGDNDQSWTLMIDTNLSEEEQRKDDQKFSIGQVYGPTGCSFLLFKLMQDAAKCLMAAGGTRFRL